MEAPRNAKEGDRLWKDGVEYVARKGEDGQLTWAPADQPAGS